jgi:hypothetical protein
VLPEITALPGNSAMAPRKGALINTIYTYATLWDVDRTKLHIASIPMCWLYYGASSTRNSTLLTDHLIAASFMRISLSHQHAGRDSTAAPNVAVISQSLSFRSLRLVLLSALLLFLLLSLTYGADTPTLTALFLPANRLSLSMVYRKAASHIKSSITHHRL